MNIKDLIAEVRENQSALARGRYPFAPWCIEPVLGISDKAVLLADEVESLNAANEELLLTLYAEQGLNKGAPSPVWRHQGQGTWHNVNTGSVVQRGGWPVTMPGESTWTRPNGTRGTAENARAAMLAADKDTL